MQMGKVAMVGSSSWTNLVEDDEKKKWMRRKEECQQRRDGDRGSTIKEEGLLTGLQNEKK